MNWNDYDVFCQVIEHGGFSAAARILKCPKSTVSASIGRLEAALGERLLDRTTRKVKCTESGETLYQTVGPLFTELRDARSDALARGDMVEGTLSIAAPYEFGAHHVAPVACGVMARYPKLKIHIDVEHALLDPMGQAYDIVFAMLEEKLPAAAFVQRRMFSLKRGLFASPELLRIHGEPNDPQELLNWPLLCGSTDREWTFTAMDGTIEKIETLAPRLKSGNANVRLQAALAGLGVARITTTYCEQAIRAGLLCPILPNYTCMPLRVYALLPSKRLLPAKVRTFLDALGQHATQIGA